MNDLITTYFPGLREAELREKITTLSKIENFPPEQVILKRGQYVKYLPLVISGRIKVLREEKDREILLYYIESGESCAMSLTAYLNESQSEVKAITTEPTEAILLPTQYINDWIRLYNSWQQFAFSLYQQRFQDLLDTLDDVAFRKMDQRLDKYLLGHFEKTTTIELTHSQIAHDLGTSREVISRLLKQLEKEGSIKLNRNSIEKLR